ncbi:ATP-dependent helicase HrpB [Pelobacter seleniigenes]|uniref:ATP-dependent helicase HrpB n=1 Tax=Pelobacter seleniigenes TaxID=407188 RepID=UPI0004A73BE2|nr:ATP-dependent helicase HrpB [Pelobacter seleniigenes]
MNALPIDIILPELRQALAENTAVVLQAPPGAGKTTRVPLDLLAEPWLEDRSILMLQPRRLAARHAAEYMAAQLGEKVGNRVGYSVRFESKRSRATRIEVVTEGILTRRLQADPELTGIGLVIFDEFHERNLHSDLALALCCDTQAALREDLKLLVMSATLDAEPVAALLHNCPVLTSAGRSYPVTTRYLPHPKERSIAASVAAGVRIALQETDGDILAFLPGAGEIRRCAEELDSLPEVDVRPLFGAMPFADQRLALEPGPRRRVVLATNIAETSLTISGISSVVDSGWERRPRFDLGSGITRIELKRISAASATQRQGRAGRLGPGHCFRLWSTGQQDQLLPQAPPEIRNADLAPLLLELACWGENNPERLTWLDPPSPSQLEQAGQLLQQLGALDRHGRPTDLGKRMVRLPLPPRLARLLLAAETDGADALACELAALLSERDLLPPTAAQSITACDLETRWQLLSQRPPLPGTAAVRRAAADLQRLLGQSMPTAWPADPEQIGRWLATAWPDRIARQREPGTDRYLLSDGSGAVLSARSGVKRPPFLIAIELEQRENQTDIIVASKIDRSTLEEIFAERLQPRRQVYWEEREDRVVAKEVVSLGALALSERPLKATRQEQVQALLAGIRQFGIEGLNWPCATRQFLARVRHCAAAGLEDGWPDLSPSALEAQLEEWLAPYVEGITTRTALERFDPLPALQNLLPWELRSRLEHLVPERIEVPSGSHIRLDYCTDGPPVLAAKLQELFGLRQGPTILGGRLPVLIHLLSPAGRPLAVTRDLEHFWDQVYPEVRKEMRGRYPKHPWPDDPWNAPATARTNRRLKNSL